jgi:hypothetical protein
VRYEQTIDRDIQSTRNTIDNLETRVGDSTLDLGDRLPTETSGVSKPGLGKPGSRALKDEITAEKMPRRLMWGWRSRWHHHLALSPVEG